MQKIIIYDLNSPFNSERTIPLFEAASNILFERRHPENKIKSDIALVHSQTNFDMSDLEADIIIPFDCEDQFDIPDNVGKSLFSILDRVSYYAKSHYRTDFNTCNINNKTLKYINIPHPFELQKSKLLQFNRIANNPMPLFIGSGTFIGRYLEKYPQYKNKEFYNKDDINTFGLTGEYSQRIEWLANIGLDNFVGGITEHKNTSSNLCLDWQKKYFGNGIEKFFIPLVNYYDILHMMYSYNIHLCPAGMGRWTTRLWDSAATGAIPICTDMHDYNMLPKYPLHIKCKDTDNINDIINTTKNTNLSSLIKENIYLFAKTNANNTINDFLKQLN